MNSHSECSCTRHVLTGPQRHNEQHDLTCVCNCVIHRGNGRICPFDPCPLQHKNLSTTNIQTHYGAGIMYGIEIEVEVDDKVAVLDDFHLQHYYVVKLEQSVPGGLEFVSAPMSFFFHYVQMRKLYDWFRTLNAGGKRRVWASEKTGIHFHIQKEGVSGQNLKWLANYLTGNQQNADLFAGRPQNRFCVRNGDTTNIEKTSAIRITSDTIELRIFATFMDYENVIQRLAIVNAILHST